MVCLRGRGIQPGERRLRIGGRCSIPAVARTPLLRATRGGALSWMVVAFRTPVSGRNCSRCRHLGRRHRDRGRHLRGSWAHFGRCEDLPFIARGQRSCQGVFICPRCGPGPKASEFHFYITPRGQCPCQLHRFHPCAQCRGAAGTRSHGGGEPGRGTKGQPRSAERQQGQQQERQQQQ